MELKWTSKALSDLSRLFDFLVLASKPAAARTVQSLTQAPVILLTHPRMGEQLFQFEPREVRRILLASTKSVTKLMARLFMYCVCGTHEKTGRLCGDNLT